MGFMKTCLYFIVPYMELICVSQLVGTLIQPTSAAHLSPPTERVTSVLSLLPISSLCLLELAFEVFYRCFLLCLSWTLSSIRMDYRNSELLCTGRILFVKSLWSCDYFLFHAAAIISLWYFFKRFVWKLVFWDVSVLAWVRSSLADL